MRNLLSITSIVLIMSLGVFNINIAMNESEFPEVETKSFVIDNACASGSCVGETGNICDFYSEWIIDQCNETSFLPCEDVEEED